MKITLIEKLEWKISKAAAQNSVSQNREKRKMFARKAAIALRNKRRQELIHTLFTSPKNQNTLVELGKLYFEDTTYRT